MPERTHVRTCPLCEATCGLELRVEGERVTRIRGDRDDVFSKGYLCPKGAVLHHVHDDPDRLRTPQIRNPDGTHRSATWDEAFEEIDRLLTASREANGPESTGVYIGNPNVHGPWLFSLQTMIAMVGTRNLFSASSVDQLPKEIANGLLYGDPRAWGVPDLDRTDLLVIIGANPVVSNGSLATAPDWPGRIAAIAERGRVVVVDPRRTETAEAAGEWVPIRPGTDALLLAALVNVVFEESLVDLGAAAAYCDDIDSLAMAMADFRPEAVAPATGVPAGTIRDLARALARSERAVVYGRVGLQTSEFGTVASWLTDVVNIVTGHLDVPGGMMFADPAAALPVVPGEYAEGFTIGRWHSRVRGRPEARGELPVADLPEEILVEGPGRIRSMLCLAGNPVRSCPDSARMAEAFSSLDCLVSFDIYRNETSSLAHVILPPAGPLTRPHFDLFFYPMAVRNVANFSPPLFPPDGPTEEDLHLRLMGVLLGQGPDADLEPLRSMMVSGIAALVGVDPSSLPARDTGAEQVLDSLLRAGPYDVTLDDLLDQPHGIDFGPLRPALPGRLRTPNGRISLVPRLIEADLPRLVQLLDAPRPPHVLIGRRQLRSNNSWMHNVRVLRKGAHECALLVNDIDAEALGLSDGDEAVVSNATGTVTVVVRVTDALSRGVVSLPHGWGHDVDGQRIANIEPGVSSNLLTDPAVVDPLSGACAINGIPVTIARAG